LKNCTTTGISSFEQAVWKSLEFMLFSLTLFLLTFFILSILYWFIRFLILLKNTIELTFINILLTILLIS
jgi:hypothetical protein